MKKCNFTLIELLVKNVHLIGNHSSLLAFVLSIAVHIPHLYIYYTKKYLLFQWEYVFAIALFGKICFAVLRRGYFQYYCIGAA